MTMRTGKFLIMILVLFHGMSAHSEEGAGNYYSWRWNPDEFTFDISKEELNGISSEEDCFDLLARKPVAAGLLYQQKYAKYCMAPMVAHYLSWFPRLDPDVPWVWKERRIRSGEEDVPENFLYRFQGTILNYCQRKDLSGDFNLPLTTLRFGDRIANIEKIIVHLQKEGKSDLAKAARRGIEMRVKEGLYHPKKAGDTSTDTDRVDEADKNVGEGTTKSFGKMFRKQPGQKQLPSTKLQAQDENQSDSQIPWTMAILGILALLSALIVSVIMIRRRRR